MMVNLCYNSADISLGLMMNMDRTSVKCYMGDTGLLITMGITSGLLSQRDILLAVMEDRLHINEGMIAENMVAQMLRCNGHDLFFHTFYNRDENNNRYEIDFLVKKDGKICPIEVKSSNSSKHASLDRLIMMHSETIGQPFIINTKDQRRVGNIRFIPIYMTICL